MKHVTGRPCCDARAPLLEKYAKFAEGLHANGRAVVRYTIENVNELHFILPRQTHRADALRNVWNIVGNSIETRHVVQVNGIRSALHDGIAQHLSGHMPFVCIEAWPCGQESRSGRPHQHAEICSA